MNEERLLRRYQALAGAVPQSVWVMSPGGEVTLLAGGGIAEKLWHPDAGTSWMDAVHPKRPRLVPAGLARGHAAAVPLDTIVRVRLDGVLDRFRHIKIVAAPVVEGDGEVEWAGTATDAEEHWRSRMREKLLARMAAVPAAHDLSEAFLTTAAAVVPELADAVAVFRVRDGVQPSAGLPAHRPVRCRSGWASLPGCPPFPAGRRLPARAHRPAGHREPAGATAGLPARRAHRRGPLRGLRAVAAARPATGVALLPVVVDGRTVALATIATCRATRRRTRPTSPCFGTSSSR